MLSFNLKFMSQIIFRKLQHTTRIIKNKFNSKQIIQKLQPIFIDNFSTHSDITDIS